MEKGETPPYPPLFYFFILKRLKIHIKWGVFVNSTVVVVWATGLLGLSLLGEFKEKTKVDYFII